MITATFIQKKMSEKQSKNAHVCEFPVLGAMSTEGCTGTPFETWRTKKPFLVWDKANILYQGDITNKAATEIVADQYTLALEHEAEIIADIKANKYVQIMANAGRDALANTGKVDVWLELDAIEWGTSINGMYDIEDGVVTFVIKNGHLLQLTISLIDFPQDHKGR